MVDEVFQLELENLRKLHIDLEKQMLDFDEIIPYERQRTAQIYSPRLLNMMLVCATQIEAITRLISNKCKIITNGGVPSLIRKINQNAVLSNFNIISIPHKLQFTPFTKDLEWWNAYNELKHDLLDKQFKITYATVMNAFSALAAFHCLADKLASNNDDIVPKILDRNSWIHNDEMVMVAKHNEKISGRNELWKSLLFEIRNIFVLS